MFLDAGVNIFMEKPMTVDVAEARALGPGEPDIEPRAQCSRLSN